MRVDQAGWQRKTPSYERETTEIRDNQEEGKAGSEREKAYKAEVSVQERLSLTLTWSRDTIRLRLGSVLHQARGASG